MPIGHSIKFDATPRDENGEHTQASIEGIEWDFSGTTDAFTVTGDDCFTPVATVTGNGILRVSATADVFATSDPEELAIQLGTGSASEDEGEPAETHELCSYTDEEGGTICINGSQADTECLSYPECREGDRNTCKRIDADTCPGGGPKVSDPVANPTATPTDLGGLIGQVFNWSLSVIGLVVFVMILFSGFQWLTAAGNPGQIGQAKNRMTNALLGAALLLSAYLILNVINPNLVRQTSTLPALPGGSNQTPISTPATTLPLGTPIPSATPTGSGDVGNKCSSSNDCGGQLVCANNICQRPEGNEFGEACVEDDNCNQDLFLLCSRIEEQVIDGQTLGTCVEEGF